MTAALPLSSAERPDACAPAPGRMPPGTPPSGSSFADLLLRGQAAHGTSPRATDPPPAPAEAPPPDGSGGDRGDAGAPAAATPDKSPRSAARPAQRARERSPVFAAQEQRSRKPPLAEAGAADAARHRTAADEGGSWPPGTVPLAGLHEWIAALLPPEPSAAPPARADARDLAAAAGVDARGPADGTVASASTSAATRPAVGGDAAASSPSAGTTLFGLPPGAAPGLASARAAVEPASTPAGIEPASSEGDAAPGSADGPTPPRPAEGVALPRPADRPALPAAAATLAAFIAAPAPHGSAEAATGPRPAPGLRLQRGATDESRRADGDALAKPQAPRQAATSADPALVAAGERRPALAALPAVRDLVQGLLGGATGAVQRGVDAGAPAPIALPAPVHSPEFAQVLGAQVSVLARDGVQQAELHLSPAEMGPISVHIRIDDKDARVDFHASAAATREAIERGLPELASALREQGLTLAGGGVFQQPPDPRGAAQRDPGGAAGQPRRAASATVEAAARAGAIPRQQGMLDLYA